MKSALAGLTPLIAAGLFLAGCDNTLTPAAPAGTPTVPSKSVALCTDPIVREVAFTSPDAKDVLQVVAIGTDCEQASVLTTLRTASGELLWSRAEAAERAMVFGDAIAEGKTPEQSFQAEMKKLADMIEIKTSADAPDWKEGDPRPTEPTGLFIDTRWQRGEYLGERAANRRMLCHMIYSLSTQCLIYNRDNGPRDSVIELYRLIS